MITILIKAFFIGTLLYFVYLKGFMDCMLGKNQELYDKIKELYIKQYGEDIWGDD